MRITFNPQGKQEIDKQSVERPRAEKQSRANSAYGAAFFAGSQENWLAGTGNKEKAKSIVELQQEAANIDVGNRQDYMTVVSNTMSEADYAKLEEEGFHFASMDPEEVVTIVDKIKAELARSGQYVAGYTDDLDVDTLAAAVGSEALARSISESFQSADIPLTQENIDGVKRAWDMASQLEVPGDGANHYMIDNGMEPEICNLYIAQNSGAESMTGAAPRYYAEDIQGYFTRSAGTNARGQMPENMQVQMDRVIEEAGLELTEENRQNAAWLLEKRLPLTEENLLRLRELQSVSYPVEADVFAKAAALAILDGKEAIHANLAGGGNIYEKAVALAESFWADHKDILESGDIAARRQLEEIRLRMTAEVNVKLLRSGFAIDTAPMEELLEALKAAETELAGRYFPQDADALSKYELFKETGNVVNDIPKLPAQLLGTWSILPADDTVAQFHREGLILQETYDRANESYEALMTAPRGDMGDSIRKAFANVDAILEDLGLAINEKNQRAVRILGYNRMDLTVENIERVKETDEQVQSVVDKMTPAATLQMIRDGKNPLEMSFAELEAYFASLPQEYEESAESYSKFLYHLEKNKEITPEERDAYIGIYRLLRQLEKSDGAAVGTVVNTGAELQFANLLSAVRSRHFHHMDVKVTDETGLMQDLVREGSSISEQINSMAAVAREVVTEVSSDESIENAYRKQELEHLRTLAEVDAESFSLLERGGLEASADNLFAAWGLLKDAEAPFAKWSNRERAKTADNPGLPDDADVLRDMETLTDIEDSELFEEAYKNTLKEMCRQVEEATLEDAQSYMDVRGLQLIHKQLSVTLSIADSKEYMLPMYIGDKLGKVHLTLVKNQKEKGEISINVDYGDSSHVEAHLQVSGKRLSGYLVGNTEEEVTKLQKAADILHELLTEESSAWEVAELPIVSRGSGRAAGTEAGTQDGEKTASDTGELYRVARIFLQAIK